MNPFLLSLCLLELWHLWDGSDGDSKSSSNQEPQDGQGREQSAGDTTWIIPFTPGPGHHPGMGWGGRASFQHL